MEAPNNERIYGTLSPHGHDRPSVGVALLIVRLVAGTIFFIHGSQLMWGWHGGPGFRKMGEMMGFLGYLVAIGQFFGGIGLVLGFLTRFSAFWLIVIMLGAIQMVHWKNGFFLAPPDGNATPGEFGYEFNLALIGLLLPTLIAGPGPWAILRGWASRRCAVRGMLCHLAE